MEQLEKLIGKELFNQIDNTIKLGKKGIIDRQTFDVCYRNLYNQAASKAKTQKEKDAIESTLGYVYMRVSGHYLEGKKNGKDE